MPIKNILSNLDTSDIDVLRAYFYRMQIPTPFFRGSKFLETPLIGTSVGANGEPKDTIRFSNSVDIQLPPAEDGAARKALHALKAVINQPGIGFDIPMGAFQVSLHNFLPLPKCDSHWTS